MCVVVKKLPAKAEDARDTGSIPGSGRSLEEGNDSLLKYSCLENLMDRGAWKPTVHGATKNWTRLSKHNDSQEDVCLNFSQAEENFKAIFSSVHSLSHVQIFVTP